MVDCPYSTKDYPNLSHSSYKGVSFTYVSHLAVLFNPDSFKDLLPVLPIGGPHFLHYIHTQKVRDCVAMQNVNTSLLLKALQLYTVGSQARRMTWKRLRSWWLMPGPTFGHQPKNQTIEWLSCQPCADECGGSERRIELGPHTSPGDTPSRQPCENTLWHGHTQKELPWVSTNQASCKRAGAALIWVV